MFQHVSKKVETWNIAYVTWHMDTAAEAILVWSGRIYVVPEVPIPSSHRLVVRLSSIWPSPFVSQYSAFPNSRQKKRAKYYPGIVRGVDLRVRYIRHDACPVVSGKEGTEVDLYNQYCYGSQILTRPRISVTPVETQGYAKHPRYSETVHSSIWLAPKQKRTCAVVY